MTDSDQTYMLLYEYVDNMLERREPHRDSHLAHVQTERDAGHIQMGGPLGDPPNGAAIVFKGVDAAAIEAFVSDDPYNQAELITAWRVEPWAVR
jgi:uncharacterized protein YciI